MVGTVSRSAVRSYGYKQLSKSVAEHFRQKPFAAQLGKLGEKLLWELLRMEKGKIPKNLKKSDSGFLSAMKEIWEALGIQVEGNSCWIQVNFPQEVLKMLRALKRLEKRDNPYENTDHIRRMELFASLQARASIIVVRIQCGTLNSREADAALMHVEAQLLLLEEASEGAAHSRDYGDY